MIIVRNPLDLVEMLHYGDDVWVEFTPRQSVLPWRLCPSCIPAMYRRAFSFEVSPFVVTPCAAPANFGPYHERLVSCDGCQKLDGGGPVVHALLEPYA